VTDSESVNHALMARFADVERRYPGLSVVYGGEFEETNKSFDSLKKAFVIAVLLIYAILAAQFRSYALPFVVMTVVPFSYIGVVLGLWIMGFPFTIIAFIAIVGLSGVVVNDSIVLVDFISAARTRGEELIPAILSGCTTRLRAIFLTTITTVLGLLPTALGLTGYSKIWSPFAATISFGLALAMFLTLFLVPAVFVLIDRRSRRPRSLED
jgi:HAE1 family hydrophobic/amphiphilic exporter-1